MEMIKTSYKAADLLNQAVSAEDAVRIFTEYCVDLGFPTVSIGQTDLRLSVPGRPRQFSNMPQDYLLHRAAQDTCRYYPGLILARLTVRPCSWAQAYEVADDKGRRVVEECCVNTHAEGLFFPIHSPDFASGFASIAADHVPDDPRIIAMIGFVASSAYSRMTDFFDYTADKTQVCLSQREQDVVYGASCGLTNKEIARSLKLSPETVKDYMSSAQRKLGARDRAMAVAQAIRHRLLPA